MLVKDGIRPPAFPVRGRQIFLVGNRRGTSVSLYGSYLDDDGLGATAAPFLATSIGAPGPEVDGVTTWLNYDEPLPEEVTPDNGPPPTEPLTGSVWGVEREVTDFDGETLSEKAMARKWGILFTPTMMFLPETVGEGVTAQRAAVATMPGAFGKGTTLDMLTWVAEKRYELENGEDFQRYHARMIQERNNGSTD